MICVQKEVSEISDDCENRIMPSITNRFLYCNYFTERVKVLENYNKLVSKAASANEGVLLPLPDCPFNVQWYEYFKNTNQKIPTYIKDSSK